MGWTSTGDPYANVGDAGLAFDSEEAAKAFAEKYGWDYVVWSLNLSFLSVQLKTCSNSIVYFTLIFVHSDEKEVGLMKYS